MDYPRIPDFSSESIHPRRLQQRSALISTMSLQHQLTSNDYLSVPGKGGVTGSGIQSSVFDNLVGGGMSYASPSSTSLAFGPVSQDTYPASVYSNYDFGPYLPGYGYTNLQQLPQPLENDDLLPSDTGARGHGGYVFDPNRDPSRSPDNGMYADIALEGTFMRMECYDSPDSNTEGLPDCSYTAPQLTSPANQRAATARRKRVAKYICDMCGSKLTAKHNLTSHMNAHFGIKPFRCQYCHREYTAKSTFRRHVKTVHQDKL